MSSKSGLGIDLGLDGVTHNDAGDGDPGANQLQNFPVVISPRSMDGGTQIEATLNSMPETSFTVEIFSNALCDRTGFGQGQNFLGRQTGTTNNSGYSNISGSFPFQLPPGHVVTATATDPLGNTSEFGPCVGAARADLSITKVDSPDPVSVWSTLTY